MKLKLLKLCCVFHTWRIGEIQGGHLECGIKHLSGAALCDITEERFPEHCVLEHLLKNGAIRRSKGGRFLELDRTKTNISDFTRKAKFASLLLASFNLYIVHCVLTSFIFVIQCFICGFCILNCYDYLTT